MEYKVYVWDYGDDIYVFRNGMTIWGKLYLDKGSVANDEKTIIFQGNIDGGNPIADVVYPAPRLGSEKPIPGLSELGINMISVTGWSHDAPMYGSIADGSGGGTFGCLGGLVRMQVRGVGQNNEIAFQAKVAGANVTGGSYRWDAQKFKMVYVQGSNEVASVSRFPENGVIYLTVAVDQEVNETGAAPQTEITARLYTGAGDADGT